MTDVKRLLDEATPLPWEMDHPEDGVFRIRSGQVRAVDRLVSIDMLRENAALIVHAVNSLPDYEAAVDALAVLLDEDEDDDPAATRQAAREVLSRLRDKS